MTDGVYFKMLNTIRYVGSTSMKTCFGGGLLLLLVLSEAHAAPTAKPFDQLPKHVVAAAEQVTIYWAWDEKPDSSPLIYFVNRTKAPLMLSTFNGELSVLLYLEAETVPGKWERAQMYSWEQCGTGWAGYELPPGQWVTQPIYPLSLTKEKDSDVKYSVRFRSYREGFDASSNAHFAVIDQKLIAESKNDALAVDQADFSRLKEIIEGRDPVCQMKNTSRFGLSDPRSIAFAALLHTRHDPKQVVSLLQELSNNKTPELISIAKAAELELQKMQATK